MNTDEATINQITEKIIGCAYRVARKLGAARIGDDQLIGLGAGGQMHLVRQIVPYQLQRLRQRDAAPAAPAPVGVQKERSRLK